MNGVFDNQTSGNDWTSVIGSMLHEREQNRIATQPVPLQESILDNFEREMKRYEVDYREMITAVGRMYIMPRNSSVQDFLNAHRVIPHLLLQAYPRLLEAFGDSTILALRATSDEYGWQSLFVDALWPGDAADSYAALDRFEDAWWVENCHIAAGRLNFTYRLV